MKDEIRDAATPVEAVLLSADQPSEIEVFQRTFGEFGGVEHRFAPVGAQVRESGDPDAAFAVGGLASVFDSDSLDLGGFIEQIDKNAFDEVLTRKPDVHLLWDHDTRYVLSRTTNESLFLKTVADGLDFFGRVAPTSYAADLRILMEGGYIDQCSFAFTVEEDDWVVEVVEGRTVVKRTILKIGELYDVTICALGAYPATNSEVLNNYFQAEARTRSKVKTRTVPTPEEQRALKPGTVAWNTELGVADIMDDISCLLDVKLDCYAYCCDLSVDGTQAIVCFVSYEDWSYECFLVDITYGKDLEPVVADSDTWTCVYSEWVAGKTATDGSRSLQESIESRIASVKEARANGVNGSDGIPAVNAGENDSTDDVQGHKPTTNADESGEITGRDGEDAVEETAAEVPAEEAAAPAESASDDDEDDTDEEDPDADDTDEEATRSHREWMEKRARAQLFLLGKVEDDDAS